ncbi:DUF421 domain-containing protein [Roseinatronobacter sp. S2]|uniref:DUF421 domain-containing protein n=1 Tax=Roseinatronobacter sp. S2 TaxID=3035471 RepID=UPI00240F489C|nr:YetF domain-containing protein [Roseinatronobacter sp. S2]WFE76547.1 DUF421 domain-containing protein [Roseinatronobacter sp. S2]
MMEDIWSTISWSLGLNEADLETRHMALRAVVVFIFSVVIVRLGKKRFIGENTAFDVILGVMLGSIISRAITGQSPFVPTLTAAVVIVALHWLFSQIAVRWDAFGMLVKGSTRVLVKDGVADWKAMKRGNISQNDLLEALRLKARISDWNEVKEARLERNGEISVILKQK